MRKEKARKHFLGLDGHRRLNCAQAVIKAYHDVFGLQEDEVDGFAGFGGGRAPEGNCGAYQAAHYLLSKKHPDVIDKLAKEFIAAAGSLKCKEVRSLRRLSCLGCVEKAVDLLKEAEDGR
jgi:hypothetical protein